VPSDTPRLIEPDDEYLGVLCGNCQRFVPVVGPLDPTKMPPDKPMRVGSRGPLHAECRHCNHRAEYPVGDLIRGHASQE
jgi:hypothetical protein